MACSISAQTPAMPPEQSPAVYTSFVPFTDYSKWERRPQKTPEVIKSLSSGLGKGKSRSRGGLLQAASRTKKSSHKHSGYCTSAIEGIVIRGRPQDAVRRVGGSSTRPSVQQSESATRLRILKMQIAAKKLSVEDVRQYKEDLFSRNVSLMRSIQSSEHSIHSDVDKILEKYTKFKGVISRLKTRSSQEIEKAKKELDDTRAELEEGIIELRKTAVSTEKLVQKKSRELNVLLNYKEKDFPLKAVRIEQLKEQCEMVKERNEAEMLEVELKIAEEWDKCGQAMDEVRKDLETKATQASLATLKKSVHEKAIQNRIMEKELIIHENKRRELEDAIVTLKSSIKRLTEQVERGRELRHRPPLSKMGKCLPDTELHFDFPRQQQFPL